MVQFTEQIKQNPLLALVILVAVGVVGFLLFGLFTGKSVTVSGILLTVLVFFGLGVLLYILRGAGAASLGAEDFILLVMASAGVFGLVFLVTKFNPGSFAIYDQPLQQIQSVIGLNTIWIIFGVALLLFLVFTRKGREAAKKLGF